MIIPFSPATPFSTSFCCCHICHHCFLIFLFFPRHSAHTSTLRAPCTHVSNRCTLSPGDPEGSEGLSWYTHWISMSDMSVLTVHDAWADSRSSSCSPTSCDEDPANFGLFPVQDVWVTRTLPSLSWAWCSIPVLVIKVMHLLLILREMVDDDEMSEDVCHRR